jgi:hypothetical protein
MPELPDGGGAPLPNPVRQEMEGRFAADLGAVRIHTDARAQVAAQALDAVAFTRGQDISFSAGAFAPDSAPGKKLLAHELTHTLQQRQPGSAPPRAFRISRPGDADEREADAVAERVAGGHSVPAIGPAAAATVARQPTEPDHTVSDAVDAIIADLSGYTSRWASARIVNQFQRDAATVRSILEELKRRGPDHQLDGPGMIHWLLGDLTAEDASILRRRLIQLHAADDLAAMTAEEIKSRLEGYTSENDSHIILQLLAEYSHGGTELDGVLAALESQCGRRENEMADWLFGDLDRATAWRLGQHFFEVGGPRSVRYATHWMAERVWGELHGWTTKSASAAIVTDFELVPSPHRSFVLAAVDTRCRAERQQSAEDALMHDMEREDYQRLRQLDGVHLQENTRTESWTESALTVADWAATISQWVICGVVGILTGVISVIVDLAMIVRDVVVSVWDLLWSLVYLLSGGAAGSESWLRVKQFFIGMGRLFTDPGAVFTAAWGELALDFRTITGPFRECQRAEFVVRKLVNGIVNILLIFAFGYGLAKSAASGLKALAEFVTLAREVGWVEATARVAAGAGRAIGRFGAIAGARARSLIAALRTPIATLARIRQRLTAVLLAAEDLDYWAFLRRRAGAMAQEERRFWQENRSYWRERARLHERRHAEVETTADNLNAALEHEQGPENAEQVVAGTDQDARSLNQSVEGLQGEVAPEAPRPDAQGPGTADQPGARPDEPPRQDPHTPPEQRPGRGAADEHIRASAETPDGRHEVKVRADGILVRCSALCRELRQTYASLLSERPDLNAWLNRIEALAEGNDEAAANAARLAAPGEQRLRTVEELRGLSNGDLAAQGAQNPPGTWLGDEIAYEATRRQQPGLTYGDFMTHAVGAERPPASAPGHVEYNLPGDLEFRYRRYVQKYRANGRDPSEMLTFDRYREGHFETSAVPDNRPGRPGGAQQLRAKRELAAAEGFQQVENVPLDGHFPDMVRPNAAGGRDFVEVGEMLGGGLPEEREAAKLRNEIPALGPNDTLTFVDKTNIQNRITYRPGENPEVVGTRRLPGRRLGEIAPRGGSLRNARGGFDYLDTGQILQSGIPSAADRRRLAQQIAALQPNDVLTFMDRTDEGRQLDFRPGDRPTWLSQE